MVDENQGHDGPRARLLGRDRGGGLDRTVLAALVSQWAATIPVLVPARRIAGAGRVAEHTGGRRHRDRQIRVIRAR